MRFIKNLELPHHKPDQGESFSWILDQNLEAEQEEEAAGLLENLQAKVEALKEQARHIQCQLPKPKKKPKKAVLNGWKQKNKLRKPQSIAMSQPGHAEEAQTEVPRSNNKNRTRSNQRNNQRRKQNKRLASMRKSSNKRQQNRNEFQSTVPHTNSLQHGRPRPYQTANLNQERNVYFCSARCTYNRFGQRRK